MAEDKTVDTQTIDTTTDEKIKVGEKEYSQDELNNIVNLGETAHEFETKWNRKIDQFYPDYTQKSQRLAELERQEADRAKAELDRKAQEGNLSPEEERRLALDKAKEWGFVTRDDFETEVNKTVLNTLAAKEIISTAQTVISGAVEKGQPKETVDGLIAYMQETGVRDPEKAYKLKHEAEIDTWKEAQLGKIKQPGLDTQTGSSAGAKQPPAPTIPTKDTLNSEVERFLRSRGGQ